MFAALLDFLKTHWVLDPPAENRTLWELKVTARKLDSQAYKPVWLAVSSKRSNLSELLRIGQVLLKHTHSMPTTTHAARRAILQASLAKLWQLLRACTAYIKLMNRDLSPIAHRVVLNMYYAVWDGYLNAMIDAQDEGELDNATNIVDELIPVLIEPDLSPPHQDEVVSC